MMNHLQRVLANTDIAEILVATPPGHQHLRTTIKLQSGEEIVLQEATVANLVRAYVSIKTHPQKSSCRRLGTDLTNAERKAEYASWQLLEEDF